MRTCVGCRERAPAAELLRVVVNGHDLVPDPARRLPGRGASLHLDPDCLALAERRRAFGRALRTGGVLLDPGRLHEYLAAERPAVTEATHTGGVGSHPHPEEK
ncbi:MAG TPA: YlxR family protein [Mycobacteriales bacterium]|nr:YlxR family protein [Mycobacteriales bacterium]